MNRSVILYVDAAINLLLGGALIAFPVVRSTLGVPNAQSAFYPNVLGGVLFGIGIALVVEARRRGRGFVGLGVGGAIAINLSGGSVLAAWLVLGDLDLPVRGIALLWTLAAVLVLISATELVIHCRPHTKS